jgi:hypothetical protein
MIRTVTKQQKLQKLSELLVKPTTPSGDEFHNGEIILTINDLARELILLSGLMYTLPETRDTPRRTPPRGAQKMLWLIPDKTVRLTSIGDLEEEFPLVAEQHGTRFAKRWYAWQACCITATYIGRQLLKALVPATMFERLIRALFK